MRATSHVGATRHVDVSDRSRSFCFFVSFVCLAPLGFFFARSLFFSPCVGRRLPTRRSGSDRSLWHADISWQLSCRRASLRSRYRSRTGPRKVQLQLLLDGAELGDRVTPESPMDRGLSPTRRYGFRPTRRTTTSMQAVRRVGSGPTDSCGRDGGATGRRAITIDDMTTRRSSSRRYRFMNVATTTGSTSRREPPPLIAGRDRKRHAAKLRAAVLDPRDPTDASTWCKGRRVERHRACRARGVGARLSLADAELLQQKGRR